MSHSYLASFCRNPDLSILAEFDSHLDAVRKEILL